MARLQAVPGMQEVSTLIVVLLTAVNIHTPVGLSWTCTLWFVPIFVPTPLR